MSWSRAPLVLVAVLAAIVPTSTAMQRAAATRATPVIDGRIGDTEWAGATHERLAGGGEVFLLQQNAFLYVAVRGPSRGLASLCAAADDVVRILHASAAVGEARYDRTGDHWSKQRDFAWSLRDAPNAVPTEMDKARFLASTGWIANASRSESHEREFQIRTANLKALGVTFLSTAEPMTVSYWPATMDDDCRAIRILQGFLPDEIHLHPSGWHAMPR